MQQNLFSLDNEAPKPKKGLVIGKQIKKTLTKKQKEFNKLVKQLENLQKELIEFTANLDECLHYYSSNLYTLEQEIAEKRAICVKLCYKVYKNKKHITKQENKLLGEVILIWIDDIFKLTEKEPDEEVKAIFKEIGGTGLDEIRKNQFNEMKDEIEGMFDKMGMDINLDEINEKMTEEEVMLKIKEIQDSIKNQTDEREQREKTRKKTKKQLQQEDREKQIEEARKKNIGTIYKQLAKIFHPDLEKEVELKAQKEELMKQLTVAYENNDLHTLLKLEMEWIIKEENNLEKLSDDKLGIYNEVLSEQVENAEMEFEQVGNHPRYMHLNRFEAFPFDLDLDYLELEKRRLSQASLDLSEDEKTLKGNNAEKFIKDIIHAQRRQNQQKKEEDFSLEEMEEIMLELLGEKEMFKAKKRKK